MSRRCHECPLWVSRRPPNQTAGAAGSPATVASMAALPSGSNVPSIPDQCTAAIRSFDPSEVARSDGVDPSPMSAFRAWMRLKCPSGFSRSTAGYICEESPRPRMSKSPHTSNDPLRLDSIAGDSSDDPVGASCRLRWAEHCRIQPGTFSGPIVADCPPSLALPLRPRIEDLRTTAYGSNFRQ